MTSDAEHGPAPARVRVEGRGRGRALHRARAAGGGAGQVGGGALLWHRAEGGVLGGVELGGGAGDMAGRGAEVRVAVGGGVARVPHRQHARVPVAAGAGGVAGGGQLAGGLQRAVAVAVCEGGPGGGAVGGVVLGADQVLGQNIKLHEIPFPYFSSRPHRLGLEVALRLVDGGHPAGGVRLLPALLILRVRQRRLVVQTGRAQAANIFMLNEIFLYFIF